MLAWEASGPWLSVPSFPEYHTLVSNPLREPRPAWVAEISPVTGSARTPQASSPNLPPLLPRPHLRSGPASRSRLPAPPAPLLRLPPSLALHVTICGTILLCHSPCHPLLPLPPPLRALPASLCIPPSRPFSCSFLLFLSSCQAFLITPPHSGFPPTHRLLSVSPSLSTSDPPLFPLYSYWFLRVPCSPFLFFSLGAFSLHPRSRLPLADPPFLSLPPPHPHQDVSWRWGVTHQAPVGSQGQRPDGSGSVGRCGCHGPRKGPGPVSSLEVGIVWGTRPGGARARPGTGQGERAAE